jgi:hypothetical protein
VGQSASALADLESEGLRKTRLRFFADLCETFPQSQKPPALNEAGGFCGSNLFDFALFGDRIAEGVQAGRIGRGGGGPVLLLDLQVNFLAVDGDIARGGDTEAHLVAPDFNHGNFDIVADFDALIQLTG